MLIDRFSGDKAVHDLPRVMRLPGFAHQKDVIAAPPFVTRMIEEREGTCHPAEFPVPKPNGGGATTEDHTQYAAGNGQDQDSKVESKWGWLNTTALQLQNQSLWVPHLFPGAEFNPEKGHRISSQALGRDNQEDIGAIGHPHSTPRARAASKNDTRPIAAGLIRGPPGSETYGNAGLEAFIRERIRELARGAFAAQGKRAFECTLRSACLHEASHAAVYSALGRTVTRVSIRRRSGHWLGRTDVTGGDPMRIGPDSSPLADLDHATNVMAGFASEMLFDEDFRQGSSLDEVAMFNAICENVSVKTGADIVLVQKAIIIRIENILRRNREIVLRVARKLAWHRTLRERELSGLLAGVVVEAAP
jgi:hypothetical protein